MFHVGDYMWVDRSVMIPPKEVMDLLVSLQSHRKRGPSKRTCFAGTLLGWFLWKPKGNHWLAEVRQTYSWFVLGPRCRQNAPPRDGAKRIDGVGELRLGRTRPNGFIPHSGVPQI